MKVKIFTLINILMIFNLSLKSASLPDNYYGDESMYGYYEAQQIDPMLGASYNLQELTPGMGNPNNDYTKKGNPINDNLYSGSYLTGDTIYYNQHNLSKFYTLIETDLSDYLTFNSMDGNGDYLADLSELEGNNNELFEKGTVLIGDFIPLYIMSFLLLLFKFLINNKKQR